MRRCYFLDEGASFVYKDENFHQVGKEVINYLKYNKRNYVNVKLETKEVLKK